MPSRAETGVVVVARMLVKWGLQQRQQGTDSGKVAKFRLTDGLLAQVVTQHVLGVGAQHQGRRLARGLVRQPGGVAGQPGIQRSAVGEQIAHGLVFPPRHRMRQAPPEDGVVHRAGGHELLDAFNQLTVTALHGCQAQLGAHAAFQLAREVGLEGLQRRQRQLLFANQRQQAWPRQNRFQ
jgi:hypothetical protein